MQARRTSGKTMKRHNTRVFSYRVVLLTVLQKVLVTDVGEFLVSYDTFKLVEVVEAQLESRIGSRHEMNQAMHAKSTVKV